MNMKINRYYNTIKYLKLRQIIYQVKYRVLGYTKLSKKVQYKDYRKSFSINISTLDCDQMYVDRFQVNRLLNNEVVLLNETMLWEKGKWNDSSKNHLWNFNLHYLEHLIPLAVCYKESKDKRYLEKFEELYHDWHECFISKLYDDAWHPYTISLRIKNLLICIGILKDESNISFYNIVYQDLYTMYSFLLKNQEKNLLGNHYFENICSIFIASVFFKEEMVSQRYEKVIIRELKEQILKDGIHYERSFMYHNLILEDLLRVYICSNQRENVNENFKEVLEKNIRLMSDAIFSIESLDSGRIPLFNDAGSNVAKTPNALLNSVKEILSYEPEKKYSFCESGYYLLENRNSRIIFDCGDIAPKYISGHGHCDALSFELFFKGNPVFVNAGTFHYQTELRSFFRSDEAHNTIQVGKSDQSEIWGEHRTARRISVEMIMDKLPQAVCGRIKTYQNHFIQRKIELEEVALIIKDQILIKKGSKKKSIRSFFRVHPDYVIENGKNSTEMIIVHKKEKIRFSISVSEGKWRLHKDKINYYAEQFGVLEKTEVLELYQEISGTKFEQNVVISIAEEKEND